MGNISYIWITRAATGVSVSVRDGGLCTRLKGKILSARMSTKRNILELRKRAGLQVRRRCFRAAHRYPGWLGFTHCTWENGVSRTTGGFGGYRLEKNKIYAYSLEKVYLHKYSYGTACPPSSTHVTYPALPHLHFRKNPSWRVAVHTAIGGNYQEVQSRPTPSERLRSKAAKFVVLRCC